MVDYEKMDVGTAKVKQSHALVQIEGVAVAPTIERGFQDAKVDQLVFWVYDKSGIVGVQLYRDQILMYNHDMMMKMSAAEAFGALENIVKASSESKIPVTVKGVIFGARTIDHTEGYQQIGYVRMHQLLFDGRNIEFKEQY